MRHGLTGTRRDVAFNDLVQQQTDQIMRDGTMTLAEQSQVWLNPNRQAVTRPNVDNMALKLKGVNINDGVEIINDLAVVDESRLNDMHRQNQDETLQQFDLDDRMRNLLLNPMLGQTMKNPLANIGDPVMRHELRPDETNASVFSPKTSSKGILRGTGSGTEQGTSSATLK